MQPGFWEKRRKTVLETPEGQRSWDMQQFALHWMALDEYNEALIKHPKLFPDDVARRVHALLLKAFFLSQTLTGTTIEAESVPRSLAPFMREEPVTAVPAPFRRPNVIPYTCTTVGQLDEVFSNPTPELVLKAFAFAFEMRPDGTKYRKPASFAALWDCLNLLDNPDFSSTMATYLQEYGITVSQLQWSLCALHNELLQKYRLDTGDPNYKTRLLYDRCNELAAKAVSLQPDVPRSYYIAVTHAVAGMDTVLAHKYAMRGYEVAKRVGDTFHTGMLANMLAYTTIGGGTKRYTLGQVLELFRVADAAKKKAKQYVAQLDFDNNNEIRARLDYAVEMYTMDCIANGVDEASIARRVITEPMLVADGPGSVPVPIAGPGNFICDKCHQKAMDVKKCAQCKQARYCSKECQKAHWKEHKKVCAQLANAANGGR